MAKKKRANNEKTLKFCEMRDRIRVIFHCVTFFSNKKKLLKSVGGVEVEKRAEFGAEMGGKEGGEEKELFNLL